MAQATNPSSAADSADDVLANSYYMDGLEGNHHTDPGYDPSGMKEAIEELSAEIKKAQESGGDIHDVTFMTSELLALMSGYGGARVGADGEAQSALTGCQSDLSEAWNCLKDAGDGTPFQPIKGHPEIKNNTQAFYYYIDKAASTVAKEVKEKKLTPAQAKTITDSLTSAENAVFNFQKTFEQNKSNYPQFVQDHMEALFKSGDILGAIYYISRPQNNPGGGKDNTTFLGDPQYLQTLNSGMTSANQQITGASQVMATIAKTDSKTQQSEETAYNNFLQMIKKMNAYLVQLQRTT